MKLSAYLSIRLWCRVLLLLLAFSGPLAAQAQGWNWAAVAGGAGRFWHKGLTVDSAGNTYVLGGLVDTATIGATTIVARPRQIGAVSGFAPVYDAFIAKIDPAGNWLWSTRIDLALPYGFHIWDSEIDAAGNLYVTGSVHVPPRSGLPVSFGSLTLPPRSGDVGFLGKLNANGQWAWVTQQVNVFNRSLAVDANGNVVLGGDINYASTADLGFTVLTAYTTVGTYYRTGFIAKYSSQGQGLWATTINGGWDDNLSTVDTDGAGNIYVRGTNSSPSVAFGQLTLPNRPMGGYLAKCSPSGVWQWAKSIPGGHFGDMQVDAVGNIYVTDRWERARLDSIGFDSLPITVTDTIFTYLGKLNALGAWQWVTPYGREDDLIALDVAVGPGGEMFVAGYTPPGRSRLPLRFGPITLTVSSTSNFAGFVAKLNSQSGQVELATMLEGDSSTVVSAIAVGPLGNLSVLGSFQQTLQASTLLAHPPYHPRPGYLFVANTNLQLPRILSFSPRTGSRGQIVTISGTGLTGVTAVTFNGVPVSSFSQPIPGALVVQVPAGATTGVISVTTSQGTLTTGMPFEVTHLNGLPADDAKGIALYPNPTHDLFTLRRPTAESATATLLDVLGRPVRQWPLTAAETRLSVAGVPAGTYVVRVVGTFGVLTRRVVVE